MTEVRVIVEARAELPHVEVAAGVRPRRAVHANEVPAAVEEALQRRKAILINDYPGT
jgi:hypothetical protein